MHCLVTGASGFIGGYVVDRLIADGHTALCFDRNSDQKEFSKERSFYLGDVMDEVAVTEAMAHVDSWMHLAGVLGTAEQIQSPIPAAKTNILGGLNVLQSATQYRTPGVIITVGNYWENNTYSISKSCIERFATMTRQYNGAKVSIVRGLNIYGPKQKMVHPYGISRVRKIMPNFIAKALLGEPLEVYSDLKLGSNVMDMIFAEDAADVLVRALYATVALDYGIPDVIEAGTGRRTTVDDIANMVIRTVGSGSIKHLPMRQGETPGRPVVGDPSTLGVLGMSADKFVPLEVGIERTVAWYRENWLPDYVARSQ